jgi:hypothetical protein
MTGQAVSTGTRARNQPGFDLSADQQLTEAIFTAAAQTEQSGTVTTVVSYKGGKKIALPTRTFEANI